MPYSVARFFRRRSCISAMFVVLSLSAGMAQARSGIPREERHESRHEIDQLEEDWKNALLTRNVQAMDGLLAGDYIAISANGTLQTKQQTLEDLKTGVVRFSSIGFSDRKIRFYGKTALVTSRAEVTGKTGDGVISGGYRFTRVYVRDGNGGWKIVSFEASRIRDQGEHK